MTARETWAKVRASDVAVELKLGPNTTDRYLMDPKRLSFMLARYSFAAKMLADCDSILYVGAGDGFGSLTFLNETKASDICALDFDATLVEYAKKQLYPALLVARPEDAERIYFEHGDILEQKDLNFEGIAALDMAEHLAPTTSHDFIKKLSQIVAPKGMVVIGTPNKYAEHLASDHSRQGHCNLYSPERLHRDLKERFSTVIMLGMNDGALNMGHPQLWHYIFGIGVCPK